MKIIYRGEKMMRDSKRRLLGLTLAMAMTVSVFSACGGGGTSTPTPGSSGTTPTPGTSTTPTPGGPVKDSLIIATANETPSMNPYDHNAVAGSYMNSMTHDALFMTDMDMKVVPNLVADYKNISDTVWEFKLKPNVKFHDGTAMTAHDIKASLDYAKTFAVVGQYTKNVGICDVKDDSTFTLTTPVVYSNLLMDLTHHGNQIVPKALIDAGNDFNKNPIGSGPYKFVKWTLGEKVEFEAFDEYHGGKPGIKNVVWKIIPEGASRTIGLEANEVDMIIEVESMDIARLEANSSVGVIKRAGTSHNFVMINNEVKPFDNALVRKAIHAAIDKQAVVEVALNGFGSPATCQVPTELPGFSEKNSIKYDLEQAKAWLKEAGVDPASIKFPIICSDDTKRRAGEVIQANLKDIGINAEIISMDLATYLSKTAEGDYTASIGGYTSSSMLGYVMGVWHSSSINASNKTRLNNKEVDALIDKASVTLDEAARNKTLEDLSALLNDISPQLPIYHSMVTRAFNAKLSGVAVSASGTLYVNNIKWTA